MQTWRDFRWTLLLLGGVLAACDGGSGSSGFDVRSENAAITQALAQQRCVAHESLSICPAAEPGALPEVSPTPAATATQTPAATATRPGGSTFTPGMFPTATPTSAPTSPSLPTRTVTATASPTMMPFPGTQQVAIGIDPRTAVTCSAFSQTCDFALPFVASGFPVTASFRVAVRAVNPTGVWMVGDAFAPNVPADEYSFTVPVALGAQVGVGPSPIAAQVAVLVFLTPTTSVPAKVEELVDTGAYAAFVTQPFTLQPK